MMLPPIGFLGSAWNDIVAPGSEVIWLVTITATLYSSEIFCSLDIICARLCCLSANSPRPEKSTLNNAMMLSTINNLNTPGS